MKKVFNDLSEREKLLVLFLTEGIGEGAIRSLFNESGHLSNERVQKVLPKISLMPEDSYEKALRDLKKEGVEYLVFTDSNYPESLKNIPDFPPVLFYKGNIELLTSSSMISVVGTRKITDYGKMCTKHFIDAFVDSGCCIVSGMAFGVDKLAHETALKNGGTTIAVLASGVDQASPASNYRIYKEIIDSERGLVISEHFVGTAPVAGFFPKRNRIISGLSKATLVIEAGDKSGSLITAQLAFDQNREVYAIPGNLGSNSSLGTNKIIHNQVAKLALSPSTILKELGEYSDKKKVDIFQNLKGIEKRIIEEIKDSPKSLDELSRDLKAEVSEISHSLTMLELNGMVTTMNSKYIVNSYG